MENLKIPNNSKTEEQVLNLLEQLGYFRLSGAYGSEYLFANGNDETIYSNDEGEPHIYQLLTLDQLQDKVVLHRNDVNDATHDDVLTRKALKLSEWYLWNYEEKVWVKHDFGCEFSKLKPIQKPHSDLTTEMSEVKEYLDPEDNYSYHKCAVIAQGTKWIEIPDGAELYAHWPMNKNESFHSGTSFFESDEWSCCAWDVEQIKSGVSGAKILWQRTEPQSENKTHTIKVKGFEDLIDGPVALRAALDGQTVQMSLEPWEEKHWDDFLPQYDETYTKIFFTNLTKDGRKIFFRLKPQFIKIGDIKVPTPLTKDYQLKTNVFYYITSPDSSEFSYKSLGLNIPQIMLERGLVHLTEANAIAHAKALILVSGGSID